MPVPDPASARARKRRTILLGGGVAVAVLLVAGVLFWRLRDTSDDRGLAEPKPTDTTTLGSTPSGSTSPPDSAVDTGPTTTFPAALPQPEPAAAATRDPRQWPFAWNSIWNMPLGSAARRVPAGMSISDAGVSVDEDILILEPNAPRVDVLSHDGGWNPQVQRCDELTGSALVTGVPIPTDFVTDPGYLGDTPNHAAAILLADGDTLVQTQPLHRCETGGPAVSQYLYAEDSLRNGTGIAGAHGGSRMSSLGGAIRLGELVPGGAIPHALKVNIDCESFCSYDATDADGQPGFRWPALAADQEAPGRYRGAVPELQMGALLALPSDFAADGLRTEPARMVARALMRYGAYVVDDTHYPILNFTTEWSPKGRVIDEFERSWGFRMHDAANVGCNDDGAGCAWVRDMGDIIGALEVIDNNGAASIGGGGAPLAPCAPAYADGSGAAACPTA